MAGTVTINKVYDMTAQIPIRNNTNYGAVVAENLRNVGDVAKSELGHAAQLVSHSHCLTLVPSPVIGGGALLFTLVAVYRVVVTEAEAQKLGAKL